MPTDQAPQKQPAANKIRDTLGRNKPSGATITKDATAGLIVAVSSVPDGMASSLLANAAPIYGLYASIFGPLVGGILASTGRMMITTTSASALAASQVLISLPASAIPPSLFLLVIISGILLLAAGLLKLGVITKFVSHSVMTGFLIGVSLLIVLGQLGDLTGYDPQASNKVAQAIEVVLHIGQVDVPTVFIGILTIVLAIYLPKTPLRTLGQLVALVIPTVLVLLLNMTSVAQVNDVADIPRGVPLPSIPALSFITPELLTGAIAIAVITLVQSTGVSQSTPNLDGSPSDKNRDYSAQGVANIVTGMFQGIPVGGSVGQTALNLSAGALTRWASILSGVWMLAIVLIFPGVVSIVPMSALAALLILAGIQSINLNEAAWIWRTGLSPRITIAATFVATLFLPIQVAVAVGAILSAVLYVTQVSTDVKVVEVKELPDGRFEERKPPAKLPDNAVTMLVIYGSLFYAGVRTVEQNLPTARGTTNPVVLLRLRGTPRVGATFVDVLGDYAEELRKVGGQLYVSGLEQHVYEQLLRSGKVEATGDIHLYMANNIVGESSKQAFADATLWVSQHKPTDQPEKDDHQP